jgi:hypothetical protein
VWIRREPFVFLFYDERDAQRFMISGMLDFMMSGILNFDNEQDG